MTIDRRSFLGAAGAAGALSIAGVGTQASAETQTQGPPAKSTAKVIDVHTHMYSPGWMQRVDEAKDANFHLGDSANRELVYRGEYIGAISQAMLNYDIRLKAMDEAGVDIALVSLTAPNVYWGTKKQSAGAARAINDDYRAAEQKYDGRIRWFASLPWQYASEAKDELKRAKKNGAIGVCMLTNILGTALTEEQYRPIWAEIEAMDLPVFVHPTLPFVDGMGLKDFGLGNTIGFTTETSLCFARMILDGFLDAFPKLNLIACHGGGEFPYLVARFDRMWEVSRGARKIETPPSTYMSRIWYDSIVYDQKTMEFLVDSVGADRVLYGSDYPFSIGDMKGVLSRVDALAPGVRDMVRSGNAVRLFDL
jgi:aminocarboxymuconate-semialdehyde decarboxylase